MNKHFTLHNIKLIFLGSRRLSHNRRFMHRFVVESGKERRYVRHKYNALGITRNEFMESTILDRK